MYRKYCILYEHTHTHMPRMAILIHILCVPANIAFYGSVSCARAPRAFWLEGTVSGRLRIPRALCAHSFFKLPFSHLIIVIAVYRNIALAVRLALNNHFFFIFYFLFFTHQQGDSFDKSIINKKIIHCSSHLLKLYFRPLRPFTVDNAFTGVIRKQNCIVY